jgi:hypothetical protein
VSYKPEDFFVGVIDFFAVLLPGALLSFLMIDFARWHVFGRILPPIRNEAQGWVVFAFSSYLLGHFVFLAGSYTDPLYHQFRRRFVPKEKDRTYLQARKIKETCLGDSSSEPIMNTFQWAKANAQLRYPAALLEVRRHEADSKFFRSLIVVLAVLVFVLISKAAWIATLICLPLIMLSFARYAEQRWKAAQRAYEYVIAMQQMGGQRTESP